MASSQGSNQGSRGGHSSHGKAKNAPNRDTNLAEKYQTTGQITTAMLRNIPTEYTQEELMYEVCEVLGSPLHFDFFYLPWDTQNACNMGYCFMNFLTPALAQDAVRAFSNYIFKLHGGKKEGRVSPAHIQGLENNLRHLKDRAVVLGNKHCSPIVMWKGQKVELSRIFQEIRMQDTLRTFESGGGSSPGKLGIRNSEMQQAGDDGGAASEGLASPFGIDENFANLLDRAASEGAARQQAMASQGVGMSSPMSSPFPAQVAGFGMVRGEACAPGLQTVGPPPGQFAPPRKQDPYSGSGMGMVNQQPCLAAQELLGHGVTIDPDMYNSFHPVGVQPAYPDMGLFDHDQFPCENMGGSRQGYQDFAGGMMVRSNEGRPQSQPQMMYPMFGADGAPRIPDGGSNRSNGGRQAMSSGAGLSATAPSFAAPTMASSSGGSPLNAGMVQRGFTEIQMKSADQILLDKFMQKFGT